MGEEPKPVEQRAAELFASTEKRTADAFERVVQRQAFGELLAMVTENLVAINKLSSDAFDLVLRNLRLASRRDLTLLGKQLARSEDKIELLLQEIEELRDDLGSGRPGAQPEGDARSNGRAKQARRKADGRARRSGARK